MSPSENTMRVTAESADITPVAATELAGFSGRRGPFRGIHSKLEANAVAFRDKADRHIILMTVDALFVGAFLQDALESYFTKTHRQNAADLMVLASHTHFAPSLDQSKPALGAVEPAYLEFVVRQCKSLIDKLMAAPGASARIRRGAGRSIAAINRRRRWMLPHLYGRRFAGIQHVMAPNPDGPVDRTITALTITDSSGDPIALVWHYACHPTGFPNQFQVSAEFPGVVRALLRRRFGDRLPVLFLQGFAGDVRPRVPETRPAMRRAVRCVLWGPSFNSFTPDVWEQWASTLAEDVLRGFTTTDVDIDCTHQLIRSTATTVSLSDLLTGAQSDRPVRFQRLQITSVIDLIGVAAEPLTGLRSLIPFEGVLGTGYLGDAFGYWPTDGDACNGGYEVNHFLPAFGLSGQLRHRLDATFRSAVSRLHDLR